MKKLVSILLTLVMVLGLTTAAFATEGGSESKDFVDVGQIEIVKTYKVENPGTLNLAETFSFKVEGYDVSDSQITDVDEMPKIDGADITYGSGEASSEGVSKTVTINLPATEEFGGVGVYTYKITEVSPEKVTAGVIYDNEPIYLKVTVLQQGDKLVRVAVLHKGDVDGTKAASFLNKYQAGSLSITKKVTGNLGDTSKYFKVTVTLTGVEGKNYAESYTVTGGTKIENGKVDCASSSITIGQEKVFYLKDGETIEIANLPYGVTYTVQEDDYTGDKGGYVTSYVFEDTKRTINSASDTVTITNNKEVDVDTGITMDNLPFILILGVALVGVTGMLIKRRLSADR